VARTSDDIVEIESALAKIKVQGAKLSEEHMNLITVHGVRCPEKPEA
jgi:hypothetical protein